MFCVKHEGRPHIVFGKYSVNKCFSTFFNDQHSSDLWAIMFGRHFNRHWV